MYNLLIKLIEKKLHITKSSFYLLLTDSLNSQSALDVIPKYFFNAAFSLETPSTFASVLPWDSVKARGAWAQVQERLTHYLDLVEVSIARQVSRKSAAFFQALSSQDILREKLASTLAQTQEMR